MKSIYEAIGEEIVELYNQCYEQSVFPKVWKGAKIIWTPKKNGAPRPISLLRTLDANIGQDCKQKVAESSRDDFEY